MRAASDWTSASDLADFAFCPRSHYYHEHPPPAGPTADGQRRAEDGRRHHASRLGAERARARHGGAYWTVLALGVLLAVGGIAWILRP